VFGECIRFQTGNGEGKIGNSMEKEFADGIEIPYTG